jgi:hypothetical protein
VIPVSLLKGLADLIEETEKQSLVSGLYDISFKPWLMKLIDNIEFMNKQNAMFGNHEHYDAIIKLISVSITEEEGDPHVAKLLHQQLYKQITIIIKNSTYQHDRYLPCLQLIQKLSKSSKEAADRFMEMFLHTNLIANVKRSLSLYRNYKSFNEHNEKLTM